MNLNQGLLGYWPLARDGKDFGPNRNNMLLIGSPVFTGGSPLGGGMTCNGTSQGASSSSNIDLSATNQVSFSCWASIFGTADFRIMMEHTNDAGSAGGGGFFFLTPDLGNAANKLLGYEADNGVNGQAEITIVYSTWHMYTITVDRTLSSAEIQMYIDGVIPGSLTRPADTDLNPALNFKSGPLNLMARNVGGSLFCPGIMSHARLYNRTLTPQEVFALYNLRDSFPNQTIVC